MLFAVLTLVAEAVQLQDTTFSMTFRVQKDQFDRAREIFAPRILLHPPPALPPPHPRPARAPTTRSPV